MRGRKPELKVVDGGLSKAPPAPVWLSAEAKSEWRKLLPGLVARRTLTREDLPVFVNYCVALGDIQRARAAISRDGDVIQTPQGPRRHWAFQTQYQAMTEARRLAAELGLSPASRSKAAARDPGETDDLSGFDL